MRSLLVLSAVLVIALLRVPPARPCSVFSAHDSQSVLAGNNEDYYGTDPTIIWFVPAEAGKYGYVAWGYQHNHFSQGGMNDQGLFWDGLATAQHEITNDNGTKPFTLTTFEEVMQSSATVDEAIANLREYRLTQVMSSAQLMFADKNGDSAIFEGDTIIYPTADYQIATNFLQSQPELGGYPCWRYAVLQSMMEQGLEVTVEYFTAMADAAHQGVEVGPDIYTRYTTIGDLVEGKIYLYFDLDYDRYVLFDLDDELALGEHEYLMSDLFPPEPDGGTDGGEDGGTDAGTDAGEDAGADEPATTDDGGGTEEGGGCGCQVSRGPAGSQAGMLILGVLSLVPRRTRRRKEEREDTAVDTSEDTG